MMQTRIYWVQRVRRAAYLKGIKAQRSESVSMESLSKDKGFPIDNEVYK